MRRHSFAFRINNNCRDCFRELIGKVWADLSDFLEKNQISNFSLWNAENLVFGYCETADDFTLSESERKKMAAFTEAAEEAGVWLSLPGQGMRLMYHDFGIVRENKNLIRHRVFMTRLKPGCEEEYKRRHDRLVEARGDAVTEGPDSNFSIWYAGGYVFGYDEIDTTMEHDPDENDRQEKEKRTRSSRWAAAKAAVGEKDSRKSKE